ncbi:MAG: hypothetical protein HY699_16765 [Deltaproteobacteria bacterium]|nr:hypothetical protein [Deltaproteobacteria bacterium]
MLLTTFSDTLANALRTKLRRLLGNEPRIGERLEVHALNAVARRLYELNIGWPEVASRDVVRPLLKESAGKVDGQKSSLHFLTTEWEDVVEGLRESLSTGGNARLWLPSGVLEPPPDQC